MIRDTITIPAFTKNWRIVYDFLGQHLEKNKINRKNLSQILLASEEIFVNISNYAYGEKNGKVVIKYSCSGLPMIVKIKFTDKGMKFDPTKVKKADVKLSPDKRKIGGLGLFIVCKVMDEIEYKYENASNNLTIIKIIK